jgi:hypothetical protein
VKGRGENKSHRIVGEMVVASNDKTISANLYKHFVPGFSKDGFLT